MDASSTDTTGLGKTEKRDRLGNQGVSQSLVVSREDLSSGRVDATPGKIDLLVDTACLSLTGFLFEANEILGEFHSCTP